MQEKNLGADAAAVVRAGSIDSGQLSHAVSGQCAGCGHTLDQHARFLHDFLPSGVRDE
jgi:hypothetical protein